MLFKNPDKYLCLESLNCYFLIYFLFNPKQSQTPSQDHDFHQSMMHLCYELTGQIAENTRYLNMEKSFLLYKNILKTR